MKPFILTPRAEQDVSDIWDYIAEDSIEAADRVPASLEPAMYRLAKNPGRLFPFYSYLIVYRFETQALPGNSRAAWRSRRAKHFRTAFRGIMILPLLQKKATSVLCPQPEPRRARNAGHCELYWTPPYLEQILSARL